MHKDLTNSSSWQLLLYSEKEKKFDFNFKLFTKNLTKFYKYFICKFSWFPLDFFKLDYSTVLVIFLNKRWQWKSDRKAALSVHTERINFYFLFIKKLLWILKRYAVCTHVYFTCIYESVFCQFNESTFC